jgi:hypothetical protein
MTNWGNLGQLGQNYHLAGTNDYMTNLVQPTAANTKGNYVEIVSATPFDSEGLVMSFLSTSYGGYDTLFDIAMGAVSSEVDIISNILASQSTSYHLGRSYEFPIKIKAGTRLSGRSQGEYSSANNFRISTYLLRGSWNYNRGFAVCDTYGANTGDSGGKWVDPGGTANTKGAWYQITASTTRDAKGFNLLIGNASDYTRDSTAYYWNIDVGIGAAASEKVIFSNWTCIVHNSASLIFPQATPFIPMDIPAGSRLSVRAACSGTGSTYRGLDAIIYTFS